MKEIERKFLVKNKDEVLSIVTYGTRIFQGYLFSEPDRSCRVRIKEQKASVTIKIGLNALIRDEYEFAIPLDEAQNLIRSCEAVIEKTRYLIPEGKLKWEIDVFHGKLEGLILAEIELSHEHQEFNVPSWLGPEVTHNAEYLNVNLSKRLK